MERPQRPSEEPSWAEDQEMTIWRLVIPGLLAAAVVAGCFTYLVTPQRAVKETAQGVPLTVLKTPGDDAAGTRSIDAAVDEKAAAAYWDAAQAILRRAPDVRASVDEPSAKEAIPLPKRRPIPRS